MTFWGWLIMVLSVGGTTGLFVWAFYKVLTTPGESEKVHGFGEGERNSAKLDDREK